MYLTYLLSSVNRILLLVLKPSEQMLYEQILMNVSLSTVFLCFIGIKEYLCMCINHKRIYRPVKIDINVHFYLDPI